MKCQLARIIQCNMEEWNGLLVWVCQEPPHVNVYVQSVLTGETGRAPRAVRVALLNDTGDVLLGDLDSLELLPYFDDVEPVHYDHWAKKRGEQLPHDLTESFSFTH